MIELRNIFLSFQETIVFNDFSFFVKKGENICISGPSGKGKSSVLKMIQGYLLPDSGDIFVGGLVLDKHNIKSIRSQLAYVPQNIHLPVATGKELLALIGNERKESLAVSFLEQLGLPSTMIERPFDEMSGGQKQRIVIAVCLSLEREILLLDEPTASLDDESILKLIDVVNCLEDTTVVSASHNKKWSNAAGEVIYL
ncbi:ABC transporter ATP-binding protein [Anaerophaga thermohalophila]|uniref:ABC transporter ATP-binding protein n=1 Tax=Anaerophaga thermohalophila TaxID=177400 RepID=UPI000237D206|nr:ATP-binding cassette domain-containing protein [Anaerophaga thermohalophila]